MPRKKQPTERTRVTPQASSEGPKVPEMTPALAAVFAKLLSVGCPPLRAVLYVCPAFDKDTAEAVKRAWLNDAHVLQALETLQGGAWVDLPPEKRYELALDKHFSEMAFHLWATNFGEVEHKEGLDKMKQCREVLGTLTGRKTDDDDPMHAFARFAIELTKGMAETEAKKKKAPHVRPTPESGSLLDDMARVMTTPTRES